MTLRSSSNKPARATLCIGEIESNRNNLIPGLFHRSNPAR